MTVTVDKLIKKLSSMTPAMRKKEIVCVCQNGLLVDLQIKFILKDKYAVLNHSPENIEKIVILNN